MGMLNTLDLLVLTSLERLLLIMKALLTFFTKQAHLMRRSTLLTEPLPSVSDPYCLLGML
jgi:hypothetical protein